MQARLRTAPRALIALALCATVASGCAPVAAPGSGGPPALPSGDEPVYLDPSGFSTVIDHPYWPMEPGTRWMYRETVPGEPDLVVEVIVTTAERLIANGVTARVVRDTVRQGDEIVEDTLDWYAQDSDGTIWYLGEDTAEFEDGEIVSREGSFEAGVDGALPGIALPADPAAGMAYRQEYYAGHAEDNGEVLSTSLLVEVPAGLFRDALLTLDTITIEPDVAELKMYAPGVGPVLALGVSGGPGGREELIRMDRVGPDAGLGPLGAP